MTDLCCIKGCDLAVKASHFCEHHYNFWSLNGHPLRNKPRASKLTISKDGYERVQRDGKQTLRHVAIAEMALGKPLPSGAIVHHVDEDKGNNAHGNLVICPNQAYHLLLHRRQRAQNACGNANWMRCAFCRQYDDPSRMTKQSKTMLCHSACRASYQRGKLLRRKEAIA